MVNVVFTGEGCRPLNTFYGVDPSSCSAIDIENTAGDDRGGVVLSSNYVYYNGDDALVRANRDLTGLQTIGPDDVDTLSPRPTPPLFSLWNSEAEPKTLQPPPMGSCRPTRQLRPGRAHQRGDPRRPGRPPSPSDKAATTLRSRAVASLRLQHTVVGTPGVLRSVNMYETRSSAKAGTS